MNKPLELCEEFFQTGYCMGIKEGFWILYRKGKEIATFPVGIPRATINEIISHYDENEMN